MFCFFFQAEDGIRDYKVTGVQTCALPISKLDIDPDFLKEDDHDHGHDHGHKHEHDEHCGHDHGHEHDENCGHDHAHDHEHGEHCKHPHHHHHDEIGRASCRERV